MLDATVVWLLAVVAALPFGLLDSSWRPADAGWPAVAVALGILYYWLSTSRRGVRNGQTWGLQTAGLRIVRDDGRPVGLIGRGSRLVLDLRATPVEEPRFPPRALEVAAAAGDPEPGLAPVIDVHLNAARAAEARLRESVHLAGVPEYRLGRELDALMALIGRSADRAQMLHQALKDIPVSRVEARIAELRPTGSPDAIEALKQRLAVQRRMQFQLSRFHDEMERLVRGLDAITATVDLDTERDNLIREVWELRDEMSSVATGMAYAF
jgi:hypothetical protein